MFDEKGVFQNSRSFFVLLVGLSVSLLFLNILGVKKNILEIGTFLIKPVQQSSVSSSDAFKGFFGVFGEVNTLRSEYYDLQEKYLKLESESNLLSVLQEENLSLKKQLGVKVDGGELIMAEVLFQDLDLRNESMLINKGFKDGVLQGDIVVIGKMYIGIITDSYDFTSKVRLPTSRASSLKVMIIDQEEELDLNTFVPRNYLSGIAVGYSNTLKVENIQIQGDLKEGYPILINDQKVGDYLYLGNVLVIDEDPTLTLRSCSVKLPVDYSNLKYVFVRKGK